MSIRALRLTHGLGALRSRSTALARCASSSASGDKKPRSIDDSTSALDYKMHKSARALPHLPSPHPRSPSAEEAVTNILYNTPPPSQEPYKKHLLNCLVQNEPGVLSRVSGILAGRGFNIDSLVVCQTEIRDLSRMCIVLRGQDGVIEQARRQLEDLVPVWAVLDYTHTSCISRELLLAKISILGPDYVEQQMSGGPTHAPHPSPFVSSEGEQTPMQSVDKFQRERALAQTFESSSSAHESTQLYPSRSSASDALIAKNLHMSAIKTLADQFGGAVVDVSENSVIVELTAKSTRVDAFLALMRPFGVLEAARSGAMVMPRTPIARYGEEDEVVAVAEEIDMSMLPPG
ncbi:acetolactate synthase I/III small subunit, partial [Tremellales sp. Uapishka_1]